MVTAASPAKNGASPLFSFSAQRQHLLQPKVGWGGEAALGEVGWLCRHRAPAEAWFLHSLGAGERFVVLGERRGTQGWAGAGTCLHLCSHI